MMYRYLIGISSLILMVGQLTSASTLKPVESATIDTLLDLGCVILVSPPDPIKIKPNPRALDPLNTYTGCGSMTLMVTFPAQLSVRATGTGAVTAKWDATIRPSNLAKGTTKVGICVTATNLYSFDNLQAGTTVKVAQVVVTIIPL
jgi:hypothetical protein